MVTKLKSKLKKLSKKEAFSSNHFSAGNLIVFAVIFAAIGGYFIYSSFAASNVYYIASNGSDSNTGTSKSTPWLHAPGMIGCTGNCAAKTPQPGEQYIFRGGDTWYESGSGTPGSLEWDWSWSGSSTSRIYVGVDKTWYAGSSWTRPVLDGGNPTSTSAVASCTYNDTSKNFVSIESANYLTFDNFEFKGLCWSSTPPYGGATYLSATDASNVASGANLVVSNNYFHGWTHTACGSGCDAMIINGITYDNLGQGNQYVGNVFDGSDTDGKSMYALYGDCYDFHQNVVRYVANGPVCNNMHTFHDNLFEQVHESFASPGMHSNTFEFNGEWAGNNLVYNNLIRDNFTASTSGEVNVWVTPNAGHTDYYFNNVVYDIGGDSSGNYWDIENGGNAVFYNNTFQTGGGNFRFQGAKASASFINNHFITDSTTLSGLMDNSNGSTTSGNNNVFTTKTAASSLGYTAANSYAPTANTNPTVGAGVNNTSACSTVGTELCSDTPLGVGYDSVNHAAIIPGRTANARPSTGAWDAGAYQYNGTVTPPPPPPSDTTPPTVSLSAPTSGSTVSGSSVTVSANASDNIGVSGVQFKLDGANLGSEDTSSPYSINWDTTLTTNGSHTLTAVARDAAGNTKTSTSVTVTVSNTTSCSQSSTTWSNHSFTTQTSNFTFDFDATPLATGLDNVTGLSSGAASAYTSLAAIVRFNATGSIDAIKGAAYSSDINVPYTANISYHFTLSVNPTAHTYSVVVTPAGGSAVNLATNYPFRSEQATLSSFNNWALFQDPDSGGSLKVCNATINTSSGSKIGDINQDGSVDIFDLSILLSNYNGTTASCDLNTDGSVNIFDLSILLSHYGT